MGLPGKRNLLAVLVLGVLACASESRAQGSRDPADFLRRLDENGDGRLDRNELERMPSFLKDRMRFDSNRSYRIEEIADMQRRVFEEMRSGGGFPAPGGGGFSGFGGGPPGGDRRSDSGRSDSDRRDSSRGDSGRSSDPGRGDSRSDRTPSADSKKAETKKKERTPIIARLPDGYLAKDTNHDNQIGFYEWSRTDIEGFRKLDRNGDGFLTPQELGSTPGPKSTTIAAVAGSRESDRSRTEPSRSDSSRGDSGRNDSGRGDSRRDRDSGDRRPFGISSSPGGSSGDPKSAAETSFSFMDRDKDGKLSDDEWKSSLRAKPMFEKAKIEVKLPMAKEDFVAKYIQASSPGS